MASSKQLVTLSIDNPRGSTAIMVCESKFAHTILWDIITHPYVFIS